MNILFKFFSRIVGPAAVMAAGTMGAGATASLILAGAWFRYDLLWVILLVLPLFVISVDSASRIGLLNTERGMFSLIRSHINPQLAWLIFAINIPIHLFIGMGQMSVMTSSFMSIFGYFPPEMISDSAYAANYHVADILLSLVFAGFILWLLTSGGYERMQKAMTALMVTMFLCFLVVALGGFQEWSAIAAGFVPDVPQDLAVPSEETLRISTGSIIAIVGSALAPAALLGIPYMSADNLKGQPNLKQEYRKAVLNLGVIFGGYSMFVVIAGGFALYPLPNHAEIDTVHEAGKVLVNAFPEGLGFMGPLIFSAGLFMAALSTFIVVVQVVTYFCLDMFGLSWHDTTDNRRFKRLIVFWVVAPAVLAPFWSFPALLKVILLMGFNVIVIPLVMLIVIILVNQRQVVGEHRASVGRNVILFAGLVLSILLTVEKLPGYVRMLFG